MIDELALDQRVCLIGRGTANLVHTHGRVCRITETMYVVSYLFKGRKIERRYRKAHGREVGASEYGGTTIHAECQRPTPNS